MSTENNILLAEFMGYKKMHPENSSLYNKSTNHELYIEDSKYNSDWNWLMEVVDKIKKTKDIEFNILSYMVEIIIHGNYSKSLIEIRYRDTGLTTKQAVYNACIEFVKYYNNQ